MEQQAREQIEQADKGTVRVQIRMLPATKAYLESVALELGLQPWQFMGAALMVGAKTLERQIRPERFIPEDLVRDMGQQMIERMAEIVQDPEKMRAVAAMMMELEEGEEERAERSAVALPSAA